MMILFWAARKKCAEKEVLGWPLASALGAAVAVVKSQSLRSFILFEQTWLRVHCAFDRRGSSRLCIPER